MTSRPAGLRGACAVGVALVAVAVAGCGGSSQSTARGAGGCLEGWNGMANARNRERVAGAYTYAKVVTTSKDACVFALHGDDPPVLMLAG